jgi:O-acetyl-ADP-ribose deacetylase (regulator of RNase III)
MITERKGDITTVTSGIILHGVNCQGVMGAGVAKAIRDRWPEVYEGYKRVCDEYEPHSLLGMILTVRAPDMPTVVNCFTQQWYGRDKDKRYVSYDAVDRCMKRVAEKFTDHDDIHFPLIGCNLGGGHWPVVREIIEFRLPDSRFNKTLWIK